MKTTDAIRLLRATLDEHGLHHVDAKMNNRLTSAFGRYKYSRLTDYRVVELSSKLVAINDEQRVKLTILHEVAHALTEGHGHSIVWRRKCLEIGGDGQARYTSINTNIVERKRSTRVYTLQCEKCGYSGGRYRRKMTGYLHRRCGGSLKNIEL